MRRVLVAGNWKMNTGRAQALELASGLVEQCGEPGTVDVMIAPPFVWLEAVAAVVGGTAVNWRPRTHGVRLPEPFSGEVALWGWSPRGF
ncbi:MAG: hypothetical protein CM1200mP2_38770 [Planctomycetaceae bacterium]|nr:MAG: hypothetical protein CM1200mP2_38770 [Planctomycetaceae bacterium]